MKVVLSIKPEFANKIFDGEKKYEFRKSIFRNQEVKKIVVYSSSPVQKIIGEFEIDYILNEEPSALWRITSEHSGISKDRFFEYFQDKSCGYAIKIKNAKLYKAPKSIEELNLHPPQSFCYLA